MGYAYGDAKNEWGEKWMNPMDAIQLLKSRGVWFSERDMIRRIVTGEFKGRYRLINSRWGIRGLKAYLFVSKESVQSWLRSRFWDGTIEMYRREPRNRKGRTGWYRRQEPNYVRLIRRLETSYELDGYEVIPESESVLNGLGRVSYLLRQSKTSGSAWATWHSLFSKRVRST